MSLYARIKAEGLAPPERWSIFRSELIAYRDALAHERVRWEASAEPHEQSDTASCLRIFRELWGHVADQGFPERTIGADYIRQHMPELEPLERQGLAASIAGLGSFKSAFVSEVAHRLTEAGVGVTDQSLMMAARLVAAARAQAAHDCINGVAASPLVDLPVGIAPIPSHTTAQTPMTPFTSAAAALPVPAIVPPGPWATMTAHDIATLIIEARPDFLAHREKGKRAQAQTGEQTKRQLLCALDAEVRQGTAAARRQAGDRHRHPELRL